MLTGYKYTPNTFQVRVIEKNYTSHVARVEGIQGREHKITQTANELERMNQKHFHNIKFRNHERFQEIEKGNQKLLGKLIEISRKKPINLSSSASQKSLNAPFRKREMIKIAVENEAFARRLIVQQSSLNFKKIQTDFKKHQEVVNNRTRRAPAPVLRMPKQSLPLMKLESKGSIDRQASISDLNKRSVSSSKAQLKNVLVRGGRSSRNELVDRHNLNRTGLENRIREIERIEDLRSQSVDNLGQMSTELVTETKRGVQTQEDPKDLEEKLLSKYLGVADEKATELKSESEQEPKIEAKDEDKTDNKTETQPVGADGKIILV